MSSFQVKPNMRPLVDPEKLAAFASGADQAEPKAIPAPRKPWDGLDDKKRSPAFSMRFTAKELAILKTIAETTPDSMHEFCLKAIREKLEIFTASRQMK
jgi:hypothetical protein